MAAPGPLRLRAEDADDLQVISAALQDALAKVGDIAFDSKGRLLTIALNRFVWEAGGKRRVRCGLQLGAVQAVKSRNIRRGAADAVLALLAIRFEPAEAPGGTVTLTFAGDGDIAATVECIDAVLADVSSSWPARSTPAHQD